MMRNFGRIMLCVCVLAGVGYFLGWFGVSTSRGDGDRPEIHLSVNRGKVEKDLNTVKEKVRGAADEKTVEGIIQRVGKARQEMTVRDKQKQDVTIRVDASTKITIGGEDSSFSDLKADDSVSVTYEAKLDGNIARTVTVSKKLERSDEVPRPRLAPVPRN